MAWKLCTLLLAFVAVSYAQLLECNMTLCEANVNICENYEECLIMLAEESFRPPTGLEDLVIDYEWEGYDGWYNNPAHPDWGGAGTPMHAPVASCSCYHSTSEIEMQAICILLYFRYADGTEGAASLP